MLGSGGFGGRSIGCRCDSPNKEDRHNVGNSEKDEGCAKPENLSESCCKCWTENKTSNIKGGLTTEICSNALWVSGDDDSANGGADHSRTETEEKPSGDPLPERCCECHPKHSECCGCDTNAHHDDCVTAIRKTSEKELTKDACEQASEGNESNLAVGESILVSNVGQEREDAPVAKRHECGEEKQQHHRSSQGICRLGCLRRRCVVFHVASP